jgi:hypothetical protein
MSAGMSGKDHYKVEAALNHGFDPIDSDDIAPTSRYFVKAEQDDGYSLICTDADVVKLVDAAVEKGRKDSAQELARLHENHSLVNDDLAEARAGLSTVTEERDKIRAGLSALVHCQSTLARSEMREAAAEILEGRIDPMCDQSPFIRGSVESWRTQRTLSAERERAEKVEADRDRLNTTKAMRDRIRELTRLGGHDDYDRSVVMLLDDFDALSAAYTRAQAAGDVRRARAALQTRRTL